MRKNIFHHVLAVLIFWLLAVFYWQQYLHIQSRGWDTIPVCHVLWNYLIKINSYHQSRYTEIRFSPWCIYHTSSLLLLAARQKQQCPNIEFGGWVINYMQSVQLVQNYIIEKVNQNVEEINGLCIFTLSPQPQFISIVNSMVGMVQCQIHPGGWDQGSCT